MSTFTPTYGVSEPISLATPTEQDRKLTQELEEELKNIYFESREESEKREQVLGKLTVIVREWVRDLSLKRVK